MAHQLHSARAMGAIDNFLRRFGYAKLDRYGLMLTGDDRVLSTRPAVLDDGLGGKIVGWTDDDLAAMELEHIGVPRQKAPAKPIAAPASLHALPKAPPPMPLAAKVVAPAAPIAPVVKAAPKLPGMPPAVAPAAVVAAPPVVAAVVVAPPQVAAEPELTEDEWEWEIAMARARAVAEEVQQAAASIATAATAPRAVAKRKTSPGIPAVRAKTEPPVRSMPAPVAPMAARSSIEPAPLPPAPERKTVIPVPSLPQAARPSDVRPLGYQPSSQPRRLPRGTGPIGEDTVRTQPAPANDDRTSPYMTLPSEVKPVGYAHTKRVAAKQR